VQQINVYIVLQLACRNMMF